MSHLARTLLVLLTLAAPLVARTAVTATHAEPARLGPALAQDAPARADDTTRADPIADPATTDGSPADADEPAAPSGPHAAFDALLREHVRDGVVDYVGLKRDVARLDAYLSTLAELQPARLDRPGRMALWINAYNACTLALILEWHDRIDGIKDIPSSKRWKHVRWNVGGTPYSLDGIEHEILRPMGDPRVHFALVCASKSCPDLRSEAYLPERLDAQLSDAARTFLADTKKGLVFRTESGWFGGKDHNVYVSKIFSWFDDDFEQGDDEVIDFLLEYAPAEAQDSMRRHRDDLDIESLDYDWTLNDARLR